MHREGKVLLDDLQVEVMPVAVPEFVGELVAA
jgi:hypothetical protein